jgi:tetraacyldisaccharide 4'-kinase
VGARVRAHGWVRRWWSGEAGLAGRALDVALAPAEGLFRAGVAARNLAYDRGWLAAERAPLPVVGVGNLGVGGAGKTPLAAWIAARLQEWGCRPAVALRGYGADEVLVHRELNPEVPVITARRRIEAARRAAEEGAELLVLDDAFQHRALARDLDLVLVPVEGWSLRRRLLPRGPWREDATALRRAQVVVLTRKSAPEETSARLAAEIRTAAGRPVVECWLAPGALVPLHPSGPEGGPPVGAAVLAVAALADPAPFAEHLRGRGYDVELAAFPDHHPYDPEDAARLLRRAGERPMVMTLKDAVKLKTLLPAGHPAYVLPQTVRITSGGELLDAALRRAVEGRGG